MFYKAGSPPPPLEPCEAVLAKLPVGAYRVVPGDVLELEMPQVMRVTFQALADAERIEPYYARVREGGTISLPAVGEIAVEGKTLGQVEELVAEAYHPQHLISRPSIVARVSSFRTLRVSVVGAVEEPGVYELRSNEMFLSAGLMKAGGITKDGAKAIRIYRRSGQEIALQVQHRNIPVADVPLEGGETIEVQCLPPSTFTVTGLVKKPGEYDYPAGARYNLIQAMGVAGGVDGIADPQYVRIIRPDKNGEICSAVLRIGPAEILDSGATLVKPGDAVQVLHTPRTDFRLAMTNVLKRIGFFMGASYDLND